MTDIESIADLITRDPGFVVEVSGLYVCKLKSGRFHVVYGETENFFTNARDAAAHFTRRRRELALVTI